ncbi:MAG: DNA polymerase III subunit gamma/tau [Dehalococcoidia bacterium]|nr:MAG: DNA polymerase III subunit gamma/tau [Dehalococcoidia bacterium]
MTSQVFYRKWRPQTLAEVVGQEPVTTTLTNALTMERVAHAYLFCGPRGTGKTSTGRILAKAVNCLSDGPDKPCNACVMCQAINEGRALDLVEIDGASNRGIDEIRDLREKINFAPAQARFKIYIIDEVHMLTEPAFNALLKTLEEPPPHAIFVLATTEIHKIPLTILSRCQRFDFRRLSKADIGKKLKEICDQEGIEAEPQALTLIARAATGSLRDAENLLEQIILHYGSNFGPDQVNDKLGLSNDARIHELVEHILSKDIGTGLRVINSVSADGIDLRQFNRGLVDYLRRLLLIKSGADETSDISPEMVSEMKRLAADVSMADLSRAIKLFAQVDFRMDPQSTLPLELALVDCSLRDNAVTKVDIHPREEAVKPRKTLTRQPPPVKAEQAETMPEPDVPVAETPVQDEAFSVPESPAAETPIADESIMADVADVAMAHEPHSIEHVRQHWGEFVNACRGMGSSGNLDALLRSSCEAVALEGDTLTLGFYWDFQRAKIEDRKYRHLVEKKLKDVFGAPLQVRCILTPKKDKPASKPQASHPLVDEAVKLGGRIIEED